MNTPCSKLTRLTVLATAICGTTAPVRAVPEDYVFTKIVDNSGEFDTFGLPSINNASTLAFTGVKDTGVEGMYVAPSPGTILPVAESTGDFATFEPFSSDINAGGTVAFTGTLDSGGERIAIGVGGGTPETVAETSVAFIGFASLGDAPSINDAGTVAFAGQRNSDDPALVPWPRLFSWQAPGPPATVLDTTGGFDGFFIPFLNNVGTSVFFGSYDDASGGGGGVFTRNSSGTVTTIADSDDSIRGVLPYNIADDGTVAFQGLTGPSNDRGLYTSSGGVVTLVAEDSGDYDTFQDMALNSAGDLIFGARLDSGDTGIFAGADPIADRVLVPGDALFDGVVEAAFFTHGLNDTGEIAFLYTLDTGEVGIAMAVVPVLAGDFDLDGDVDGNDFLEWQRGASPDPLSQSDLADWQMNYSTAASQSATSVAIPEPASLLLMGLGGLGLINCPGRDRQRS